MLGKVIVLLQLPSSSIRVLIGVYHLLLVNALYLFILLEWSSYWFGSENGLPRRTIEVPGVVFPPLNCRVK